MARRPDDVRWEAATVYDVVALGILLALLLPVVSRTVAAVAGGDGGRLVVALLLGLLAADFVTGCLHWLADTFFSEDTPLIGPAVIAPFRLHHRDPLAMTRQSFLRVSHSNVVATSAMLAAFWGWRATDTAPTPFADAWIASLACALWLTNQIHQWAHVAQPPRPVAWLQACGLILTPARHAQHHAASHARAYCVTTGWLNPLLDGVGVFTTAARLIHALQRPRALDSNG